MSWEYCGGCGLYLPVIECVYAEAVLGQAKVCRKRFCSVCFQKHIQEHELRRTLRKNLRAGRETIHVQTSTHPPAG